MECKQRHGGSIPLPLAKPKNQNMEKEIIKLRNADVGEQVATFGLEKGEAIIVGVHRIPKTWGTTGICPCVTCAFGCWKTMKTETTDGYYNGRPSFQFVYDIRCPMFEACNARDRSDHESVNFTKIQEL